MERHAVTAPRRRLPARAVAPGYPLQVLVVTAVAMLLYYTLDQGTISFAPVFFVPFYDAAVAGYLVWAIAISAAFIAGGLVLAELSTGSR